MPKAKIKGFFNPAFEGDTFKGLNGSIDGEVATKVIADLPGFLKAAGRDYYVKKVPARILDPMGAIDEAGNIVPADIDVENQFHLVRSTDYHVVSPHTVTESYAPLSLVDIAEELQPWCDQGWISPDGVYSARNESLELLSMRLDAAGMTFPDGEKFVHYIIFTNSHATGGKAKGKIISWRVICANTFAAAISAVADFVISHRVAAGDTEAQQTIMAERLAAGVAGWKTAKDHIAALAEKVNAFKAIPFGLSQAEKLTDKLLDIGDPEKASTRAKNKKEAIMKAFNMPSVGTFGNSAYDWQNAVTFVNSSPFADINKKSKVSALDRLVRNVELQGTGFGFEAKANELLAELV